MSKYILLCDRCDASTLVTRSQAGMTIACSSCGAVLQVPTIRKLGTLQIQPVPDVVSSVASKNTLWSSMVAAIALIVGVGSLTYTGVVGWEHYNLLKQVSMAKWDLTRNEQDYIDTVRKASANATPADTWDYWNEMTEMGLSQISTPDFFRMKRYLETQRPILFRWGTVAIVSFSVFAVVAFLQRRPKKRAS